MLQQVNDQKKWAAINTARIKKKKRAIDVLHKSEAWEIM